MTNSKTPYNIVQRGIESPRDRSRIPIAGNPKESPLRRITKNGIARGLALILAINIGAEAVNPGYFQFIHNSGRYALAKSTGLVRHNLIKGEDYTVQDGDTLWDLATGEVQNTYKSDYRGYHRENFMKHLYLKNIGSEGMNLDGTLNAGKKIKMKDLNKNKIMGF